jgi:Leucine-rich repeat (LRR) protein
VQHIVARLHCRKYIAISPLHATNPTLNLFNTDLTKLCAQFVVWFAGLCRLPALSRLTELDCLAASFNNISSLPHLVPVDAAAAAVTAAADNGSSSSSSSSDVDVDAAAVTATATTAAAVAAQLDKLLVSKVPSALPGCLTRLGLAYNQLECLPVELPAALPRLSSLDLSHNRQVAAGHNAHAVVVCCSDECFDH